MSVPLFSSRGALVWRFILVEEPCLLPCALGDIHETILLVAGEIVLPGKVADIFRAVSSNFASADFRKIKTYNFQKS